MKKGITLKDIAKKLNMSVSTVSKSLNNDLAISAFTKETGEETAGKEKHNIILAQSHENTRKEESIVDVMFRNSVDDLIAAVTKLRQT